MAVTHQRFSISFMINGLTDFTLNAYILMPICQDLMLRKTPVPATG